MHTESNSPTTGTTTTSRPLTSGEVSAFLLGSLGLMFLFGVALVWALEWFGVLEVCREVCLAPTSAQP